MHFKKLFIVTALLSTQVYAQSSSVISVNDLGEKTLSYIKDHFKASYHGEFYGVRRDLESDEKNEKKINDFKIMHNPTLIYKPTSDWQALATAEFKFSDQPKETAGADFPNGYYRSLFTLTRKNIMNEKDHKIGLDVGIGRRQNNTGSKQASGGDYELSSYGNNRVFATVSKSFGKNSSALFAQYLHNDYKKSTQTTWKHSVELVPSLTLQITDKLSYFFNDDIIMNIAKSDTNDSKTSIVHDMNVGVLTYQWNDKISTYYQLKYQHEEGFSRASDSKVDYFVQYAGIGYNFVPKATVTLEVGGELAHARDGRDFFSKKVSYPELALYLDYAI